MGKISKAERIAKDEKVIKAFLSIFCRMNHGTREGELCHDCSELQNYALKRNEKCPLEDKPKCKDCHIHCYKDEYRQRMKEVMKFSGMYFIKRGRLDWVWHYFF